MKPNVNIKLMRNQSFSCPFRCAFIVASESAVRAFIVVAAACLLFLDQVEQAVSDLQRGGAIWDGKRVLAEETLLPRKVRGEISGVFDRFLFQTKSKKCGG